MNVRGSRNGTGLGSVILIGLVVAGALVGGITVGSESVGAADASGTVDGTPHINASAPNARFDPGQSGTIGVTLSNNATYEYGDDEPPDGAVERAGEAQSVTVNVTDTNVSGREEAPLTVETGEQSAGTHADGESSGPHTFDVVVDEDADAGTYVLNVTTEYVHYETVQYENDSDGDYTYTPQNKTSRTETDTITVVIEPQANFEVESVQHDVPLGGEGTVSLAVNNTGDENVTDGTVSLTSQDSDLFFGSGTATTEENVGEWNASDPHTLEFRAGTVESAVSREYPIDVSVDYTDSDGTSSSDSTQIGLKPGQRDHFDVRGVSHDVPENGEGTMTVTVHQDWKDDLSDVEVTATTTATDVYLGSEGSRSSTTYVEDWPQNVSGDDYLQRLEFRVGTTDAAVDRTYPIELQFEYTDEGDNQNTQTAYVDFSPSERTFFEVDSVDHTVPENGEGTLDVSVEQIRDGDISEVDVTATTSATDVYLGSPGSRSASTYVGEWPDDQHEQLSFRVGTTDAAVDRTYPIELQFEYTDESDNENSRTAYVDFSPTNRTLFEVDAVDHDIPRNGEGTLTVDLAHCGNRDYEDVAVTASTADSAVYLGDEGSASTTTQVGEFNESENETVTFRVGTTAGALEQPYPIDLDIAFSDAEDNRNSRSKTVEFTPADEEHLAIESVTHNVPQDGVGPVSVVLENTADKELTDLTVTASSSDSEVFLGSESSRSGSATIEKLAAGANRTVTYQVGATANAVNRTYPLDIQMAYADQDNNENQQTEEIEFRPRPEPQFLVESVEHDVTVGSTGRVTMTLQNAGPVNATETVVAASSQSDAMFFGTGGTEPVEVQGMTLEPPQTGSPTAQTYVGNLSVGETRTVTFRAGFDEDAIVRDYVSDLTISYDNSNGDEMPQRTRSVGIEPLPEQHFATEAVESDLYVGEEGDLLVNVTNTADRPVEGVVVTADTEESNVNFYNARWALERLEAGESERASFRVGITEEAEPGPRIFEIATRYRDPQGDVRQTDSRDVSVHVEPSRDAFDLSVQNATFEPGESGTFQVTLTNNRDEPLSDIQANLFTDDPLDSEDDSAFVESLDPNESATVTLDLDVGGTASEKTYSASMDFRFDNARGESELSDTQRIPIEVEEPESGVERLLWVVPGVAIIPGILAVWRFGVVKRLSSTLREHLGS